MTANAQAIAGRLLGLLGDAADVRYRSPLDHQSNALYDAWSGGRHLIVKEYLKADEWQDAPRREYASLRLLADRDLAPRPVLQAPPAGGRGPLVVYEFMSGEMWNRRKPSAAELARLAEAWLRINAVPPDGLWLSRGYDLMLPNWRPRWQASLLEYLSWAQATFPPAEPLARASLAVLAARGPQFVELAAQTPVLCFCRSDPRFANVIARPDGRLGLVDWEDSGLRDPAVDLADVLTHANQEDLLSPAEWQPFLQPYLAERGRRDPRLERRLHLYLALFPIFWVSVLCRAGARRAAEGTLAGWTANAMPINLRLCRFLARAQSWPSTNFADQLRALEGAKFFPEAELETAPGGEPTPCRLRI